MEVCVTIKMLDTKEYFVQPVWSIAASKLEAVKSTSGDKSFFKQKMLDDILQLKLSNFFNREAFVNW